MLPVDWDVSDNVHFKSITSYREFENTFGRDSDGTPLPVDHTWDTSIHEQTTQEFQLTGLAADGKFLYTLDAAAGAISGFAVDAATGALTAVETETGLPAAAGIQGIAARD